MRLHQKPLRKDNRQDSALLHSRWRRTMRRVEKSYNLAQTEACDDDADLRQPVDWLASLIDTSAWPPHHWQWVFPVKLEMCSVLEWIDNTRRLLSNDYSSHWDSRDGTCPFCVDDPHRGSTTSGREHSCWKMATWWVVPPASQCSELRA